MKLLLSRPNESSKLEEQKKQRKAEREIKRRKAYIRRLQEMELEVKDKAEALERKKAEAEREAEDARRPSSRGGGDSDRGGGFVPPHLRDRGDRRDDRDDRDNRSAEVVGAEAAVEMTIGRRVEAIDTNLEEEEDLEIATIGRRVEVTIGGAAIDEEMIAHRVVDLATEGMTEGTIEGRRHRAMTVSRDGNLVKLHLNNILIKRFTQHYTKNMTTLSKSDYLYTALNYYYLLLDRAILIKIIDQ